MNKLIKILPRLLTLINFILLSTIFFMLSNIFKQ